MPRMTMEERFERAKKLQKEVADNRVNKKYKTALPVNLIAKHREELLIEQLGLCAICENPVSTASKLYHLDHDHDTGEIRGVLCHNCNVGLGHFKDSPERMIKAINYLNRFRCVEINLLVNPDNTLEPMRAPLEPVASYEGQLSNEEFDKLPGREKIEYLRGLEKKRNWWYPLPDVLNY